MSHNTALQVIGDTNSSAADFDLAIKKAGSVATDSEMLLKTASDENIDPNRRRKCVKVLFDSYVSTNMTWGQLLKFLNAPVNWILPDQVISKPITGQAPQAVYNGNSIIIFPILPESGGDYKLSVYIAFQQYLTAREFTPPTAGLYNGVHGKFQQYIILTNLQNSLKGTTNYGPVAGANIIGYATWDTDDELRQYMVKL